MICSCDVYYWATGIPLEICQSPETRESWGGHPTSKGLFKSSQQLLYNSYFFKTPQSTKGDSKRTKKSSSHVIIIVGQSKVRMVDIVSIVNLCMSVWFNCKEKWSKGHNCKTLGKIHMIEILKKPLEVDLKLVVVNNKRRGINY